MEVLCLESLRWRNTLERRKNYFPRPTNDDSIEIISKVTKFDFIPIYIYTRIRARIGVFFLYSRVSYKYGTRKKFVTESIRPFEVYFTFQTRNGKRRDFAEGCLIRNAIIET